MLQTDDSGETYVVEKHRIKAVFAEPQELRRFPFDIQVMTGSKISTFSTKFVVFFSADPKTRWRPWSLIGWGIFDFSSETTEQNSMKLDPKNKMTALASDWLRYFRLPLWTEFNETWLEARSQRALPSLCFWADRKNKMAALASDWLSYFCHLLWNHRTEFNETWQEARSLRPLPSLCFLGRSEKQNDCPGLWLAETFSIYPLKRIQRNLTGRTIKTSTTKFVFFGPIGKQDGCPVRSVNKGGTLYSGARYVALCASCYTQVMLIEWDIGFEFLYIARLWHIGHGFLKFFSNIIFNSERKNIRKSAISL